MKKMLLSFLIVLVLLAGGCSLGVNPKNSSYPETLEPQREVLPSNIYESIPETTEQSPSSSVSVSVSVSEVDLQGWVPYKSSNYEELLANILKGNVIYHNGSYWASPEYFAMMQNEVVVYESDVNPVSSYSDRYWLADYEPND